ncbi:Radical_SAM domain containing protein [uncultured Caudovirales phage]|uniref:Radical_SAM domain containing protein n=1 Tax=uncultured Caudovirales phage TaxID=2100421 RepID=A0A6J5LYM0_9CAUD|nr:Radical_SAM domain containing protein [uncultured Caudovirales phage]
MPNSAIFCNTPWYELHIYWDGSLGICCQEDHKLYDSSCPQYNIATMSLLEWFNSDPVQQFRQQILGKDSVSACRRCYLEEDNGGMSRRIRSNQKSVIFTQAFDASVRQSPGYQHFVYSKQNSGATKTQPIDLHIDLGNYCNLACKMCDAQASSTIASQHVRWGQVEDRKYLGQDWTRNNQVWTRFKQELIDLPGLNNIHFMGGETLLTDRFEDLVDTLIQAQRFDVCFSFVTNGTVFRPGLIEKLSRFRRVGMEISIETVDDHNAYQRQGTDTKIVLENIQRYQTYANGTSITVSVRPAPSILSVGYYHTLLKYCLEHKLIVKSNLCYRPEFLDARILPGTVKQLYLDRYQELDQQLKDIDVTGDYNASDPNNYRHTVKAQVELIRGLLTAPTPANNNLLLEQMIRHCERWDRVYGYNARALYPEWQELFDQHGYQV